MRRLESGARLGLVAWAMVVTMARAVRFPNDFAEAHWLIDYRFGLARRGLAGSAYSLLCWTGLLPRSPGVIAVLAFTVFAALLLAFLAASWRILRSDTDSALSFGAAAIFATSPFVVMTAHFMGYMDHLIVLAAFGGAWAARRGRWWLAGLLATAGVLFHENFLLVGLPLVLAAAGLAPSGPSDRRGRYFRYLPLLLPFVAALALLATQTLILDQAVLRRQITERLASFPFVGGDMNVFVAEWVTTTPWQVLRGQGHAFWRHLRDPNLVRLMLPSALWLALYVGATSARGLRRLRFGVALAVTAAPLVLHALAWDTARIWTYTVVAAFGCAWLSADTATTPPAWAKRALLAAAVLIVLANILAHSPLMDHQVERFTAPMRLFLYAPFLAGAALAAVDGWHADGRRAG
jgi:hypothetical protein